MEIGKITESDDFDAIGRIYELSWKTAYKNIVPQDYLDSLSNYRWSSAIQTGGHNAFVLIENGDYIGTSSICPARDDKMTGWGEIISIYLLPEYFGKGFGKPLLTNSMSELKEMGFDKIYLWVLKENHRARKFYEKNGFTNSGESKIINIGNKDLVEVRYIYSNQ